MGNNCSPGLSLVVSFMSSFVLSFFPLDVLDGIWDIIESLRDFLPTLKFFMFLYRKNIYFICFMLGAV